MMRSDDQPNPPAGPHGFFSVLANVQRGGGNVVHVSGELDLAAEEEVAAMLIDTIAEVGPDLTVDLSAVTFCDARGLAVLVRVANCAAHLGGALTLCGTPPQVKRLFRITGLESRFLNGQRDRSRSSQMMTQRESPPSASSTTSLPPQSEGGHGSTHTERSHPSDDPREDI
ncbi:STAS domain-containing protein [Salinactinospora qingdaonensis]|uniref:Anti-sigma factor antagonist n=1 Tax=Salinactinospora qingdaonensis TaxID=702744 RepID=A0ABP7GCR8_9ACTN